MNYAKVLARLNRRREELGVSSYEIGLDAGVPTSTVTRVLDGRCQATVRVLEAIAGALCLKLGFQLEEVEG